MPIPLGILAVAGAAAGGGAFEHLATTNLTTDVSSVTLSNLNTYTDYKHLQIRALVRTNDASTVSFTLNNDTNANYAFHQIRGDGGSVARSSSFNVSNIEFASCNTNTGTTAGAFTPVIIDLLDFSNTSKFKTTRALQGRDTISGNPRIALSSGLWRSTNGITSMEIFPSFLTILSGSRFSIYGIRG